MATNTFSFLFTAPVWKYWQSLCDTHTHRQAKFGIFYLSFSWWCLCVWMCLQLLMSTRLSSHHNRQLSARRQVEIIQKIADFSQLFPLSLSLFLSLFLNLSNVQCLSMSTAVYCAMSYGHCCIGPPRCRQWIDRLKLSDCQKRCMIPPAVLVESFVLAVVVKKWALLKRTLL